MTKEMMYSNFVEVYDKLSATAKRLEKETILAGFFRELAVKDDSQWIYLLKGRIFPDYDEREIGFSEKLVIKAIAFVFGVKEEEIHKKYKKIGDLGEIAEEFVVKRKQSSLFSSKLTVRKVFSNLQKLFDSQGKGAVKGKIDLVAELLGSASAREAKYIIRTLLGQLRVGVADGILRDAIAEAFFPEEKKEMSKKVEEAFDMLNDFAAVFEATKKGKKELEKVEIVLGRPMSAMLPVKVTDIKEAFRICGKPAAIEHKYDGFRVMINKSGEKIDLFTRSLEDVTKQFPDVVRVVKENFKGKDVILDSEVVGYDPKTKRARPFEAISQRIRRKYDIEKLEKELPVEINVFDIIFYNGKSLMNSPFRERRKLLEKIIPNVKFKIRLAKQIVTEDEEEALKFYHEAVKSGEEGIMIKNLDELYRQGRRVGYMVKLKPVANDLDLVIVGAEYGSGKRGGWLTSYIVACRHGEKYVEIGKVSSGLKSTLPVDGTNLYLSIPFPSGFGIKDVPSNSVVM